MENIDINSMYLQTMMSSISESLQKPSHIPIDMKSYFELFNSSVQSLIITTMGLTQKDQKNTHCRLTKDTIDFQIHSSGMKSKGVFNLISKEFEEKEGLFNSMESTSFFENVIIFINQIEKGKALLFKEGKVNE